MFAQIHETNLPGAFLVAETAAPAAAALGTGPLVTFLLARPNSTVRTRLAKFSEQKVSSALYSTGLTHTYQGKKTEDKERGRCYGECCVLSTSTEFLCK